MKKVLAILLLAVILACFLPIGIALNTDNLTSKPSIVPAYAFEQNGSITEGKMIIDVSLAALNDYGVNSGLVGFKCNVSDFDSTAVITYGEGFSDMSEEINFVEVDGYMCYMVPWFVSGDMAQENDVIFSIELTALVGEQDLDEYSFLASSDDSLLVDHGISAYPVVILGNAADDPSYAEFIGSEVLTTVQYTNSDYYVVNGMINVNNSPAQGDVELVFTNLGNSEQFSVFATKAEGYNYSFELPIAQKGDYSVFVKCDGYTSYTKNSISILGKQTFNAQIFPGDLDNSNIVNIIDVAKIIQYYGQAKSASPVCDLNSDGTISAHDISIVIANIGNRAVVE